MTTQSPTFASIHVSARARGALRQQAVIVHANAEARARKVKTDDLVERRQEIAQRLDILRDGDVAIDGVKEPERRVGGVVEPFLIAFRKEVRYQAVAKMMRERHQDAARLRMPARAQRQAFEADHRVAAPVREPVIAGDDAPRFFARGPRARGVGRASRRFDDELIGPEHEFGAQPVRAHVAGGDEQPRSTGNLRVQRFVGGEGIEIGGAVRRGNEGGPFALAEIELEIAGAPRVADRCVSALLFEEVRHILRHFGVKRERRLVITQAKHQGRHRCVERRFEISAACDQHWRCRERVVDRRFVRTCVKMRANPETEGFDRARHRVGHDDGVLQARHEQSLLDGGAIELIGPDRQPTNQPEARRDVVRRRFPVG